MYLSRLIGYGLIGRVSLSDLNIHDKLRHIALWVFLKGIIICKMTLSILCIIKLNVKPVSKD